MKNHPLLRLVALFGLLLVPLQAITINDPGVVGTVLYGIPSGDADRVAYTNYLLSLPANAVSISLGQTFTTSSTDYNGLVSLTGLLSGTSFAVPSGYQFLFAKYDGPNAGSVVFALNGASITLPQFPDPLWSTNNQYALSGWTAFNPTTPPPPPPPPPVPDQGSALILLGLGLATCAFFRRLVVC